MLFLKILGLSLFVFICFGISQGTNGFAAVAAVGFVIGLLALYFVPSMVANSRNHGNKASIIVLNVFLGWTLLGWVVALVWAHSAKPEVFAEVTSMPLADTNTQQSASQISGTTKKCLFCAEDVRVEAIKCKHCGSSLL